MSGAGSTIPITPVPSTSRDRSGPGREPESRAEGLLGVARVLLRSGGLAGLTMARIAEKAGCSRPAVYQYFRNKEEVVIALAIESAGLRNRLGRKEILANSALSALHSRKSCGAAFLCGTHLSLLAGAPSPAAFALATRTADHVLEIVVPVIVGDFLIGLYAA